MTILYFLFSEPLHTDVSITDLPTIHELIFRHLTLEPSDRYLIHTLPHPTESNSYYIFIDDLASVERLTDIHRFPSSVSRERNRRTIWINPPSSEEKMGYERNTPWNTHYTEYFQIFIRSPFSDQNIHTIKYWKSFQDLEMYDPTPLAIARHRYLQSLIEEHTRDETPI